MLKTFKIFIFGNFFSGPALNISNWNQNSLWLILLYCRQEQISVVIANQLEKTIPRIHMLFKQLANSSHYERFVRKLLIHDLRIYVRYKCNSLIVEFYVGVCSVINIWIANESRMPTRIVCVLRKMRAI